MLSAILALLILVLPVSAHAQKTPEVIPYADWRFGNAIEEEHFFDFEAAKTYWKTLRTTEQYKSFSAATCPKGGAYSKWLRIFNADQKKAFESLKTNPDAAQIRKCHDLELTAIKWDYVVSQHPLRKTPAVYNEGSKECVKRAERNIFTHACNDIPNWFNWSGNADH